MTNIADSFLGRLQAQLHDAQGQPLIKALRQGAVADRNVDELIGIIKGVLFDGVLAGEEATNLLRWLECNRTTLDTWPASVIYPRLRDALADGHLGAEEEAELLELLLTTVGNPIPTAAAASDATSLPLTKPAPPIAFDHSSFCVTGHFASGSRNWVFEQISQRGGEIKSGVSARLDYLVIGELGSRDWKHSTHGTKILKAVQLVEDGAPIAIVSEQHWHAHLEP